MIDNNSQNNETLREESYGVNLKALKNSMIPTDVNSIVKIEFFTILKVFELHLFKRNQRHKNYLRRLQNNNEDLENY